MVNIISMYDTFEKNSRMKNEFSKRSVVSLILIQYPFQTFQIKNSLDREIYPK